MASNQFIARKGIISLDDAQVTGSLSVTGNISASIFTGSFVGDGSQLTGISAGFPYTGSAEITGSLTVTGSVSATTFLGDGSQLTGIGSPIPVTATVNTGNSPITLTTQSIVVADSTDGNLTINLPDLDAIVGTSDQKPIVVYKNDYSQNVIYVQPSGSQLVNGASQDIIVSIQLAVIYNPTSAGWVTEGTSAQSLAELELFFVPRTETGSFATTGSNQFDGNQTITGSLTVTGGINATITGSAASASYVEYTNVANKPTLVSSSAQIVGYNIFATTGSNQFNGSQAITGSLTVTGQVVAQTLNVQQVTSSIVYSSGSNIFGNSLSNTQQFTGSVSVTGSLTSNGALSGTSAAFSGNVSLNTSNIILGLGNGANNESIVLSYNSNASSRSWRIIKDWTAFGDFQIQQSTTQTGTTYADILRFSPTGAATFNTSTDTTSISMLSTGTASGLRLQNTGGTASDWIIQSDGGAVPGQAALRFYSITATAYRMSIDGSGNVGIGTTSPDNKLAVWGTNNGLDSSQGNINVYTTDTAAINTGGSIGLGGYYTGTSQFIPFGNITGKKENSTSSNAAGYLAFLTRNNATGTGERMRITSTGRVMIGGSSGTLDPVWQGMSVHGVDGTDKVIIGYLASATNGAAIAAHISGLDNWANLNYLATTHIFRSDNQTERMRINSGGGVEIKNIATTNGGFVALSPNSYTGGGFIHASLATASTSFYHFVGQSGNGSSITTNNILIFGNGDVQNTNNSYGAFSDIKLKENIKDATPKLQDLLKVKIRNYNLIGEDTKQIGVIAQELEEIFPAMIDESPDRDNDGNLLETTTKGVKYSVFVPMLIKAIQEQQSQIESLKAEIQTLKQ